MVFLTYLVIKQLVVAALLVGAFALFAVRIRRLITLMRSVKGAIPVPLPHLSTQGDQAECGLFERVKIFFTDVIGQNNVLRKPGIGLAHTAISFGFLCIQPHSLELMIRGVFPSFSVHALFPSGYAVFMTVADVMGTFCLCGFFYVLYRPLVLKPSYLPESRDAFMIILFTMLIVATFLFLNALATVSPYAANGEVLTGLQKLNIP